jgi:hypothetical protein
MRMGCNRIVAESDSTEVVEACTGIEAWWSEPSAIYANCVDMTTNIGEVDFYYVSREVNKVAHELAKDCFSRKILCNWIDEPPRFILDKLLNDVTIL